MMDGKKAILCVDDEAIIVYSIKQELKNYYKDRFIYEIAMNAERGLEIISELAAEGVTLVLVISDWLMPGMKGDEFLSHVKSNNPDTKTILVTGHAPSEAMAQMREGKLTDAILEKPWKSQDLIDSIDRIIGDLGI
jgi:DNA-binding NtrC family response regulator